MGSAIESISLSKKQIREAWKKDYPKDPASRSKISEKLCRVLLASPSFKQFRHIGIYACREWEIDLSLLFKLYPRPYAFPKIDTTNKSMSFYEVSRATELSPGPLGILEPTGSSTPLVWGGSDVLLVPGYGFDQNGNRIGTGGGYYDRFFELNRSPKRWGIAFHAQFHQQNLAHTHHDARMDAIVTECGFFPAKKVESR